MNDISSYIALFALILAITAMIFSFVSPNSVKTGILAENAAQKVFTDAMKSEIDTLRRDVDAFNRDTYKQLGDKYNELEVSISSIKNSVDQVKTGQKNWGNKWAPVLGKLKKEVDLTDDDSDVLPDTIPIPDNVIQQEFPSQVPLSPKTGFAGLMGV